MAKVIAGTKANKKRIQPVAVLKTGHAAVFRKIRCTACGVGYAVKSNTSNVYSCQRCGAQSTISTI